MPSTLGITASGIGKDALNWDAIITADAPYGWWKLNEASGNLVNSGNSGAANTTYGSTVGLTRNETGIANYSGNKAFSFSSTATTWSRLNVDLYGTNLGNANANSFEMIFKITNSNGRATLARQRADALGWGLTAVVGTGTIRLLGWAKNIFDQGIEIDTGVAWDSNKWYHVVYTWAQTESKMYLNGNLIFTKTYASTTGTNYSNNNVDMFSSFAGNFDHSRYSTIDELVVYKTTLTPDQVMYHATASGVLYQ
jgi:hypothetical protein